MSKTETDRIVEAMMPEVIRRMREALTSTFDAAYAQGLADGATVADRHDRKDIADEIRQKIER
jgi:hypothetical protein